MNTRLERFRTSLEQNAADGPLLEDLIEEFAPAIPDWEVSDCWRWDEWPRRSEFDLARNEDGVDLVAQKTDGRLIAIQAKARSGDAISPTDIQKLVGAAPDEIFGERWFVTTAQQTARIEKVLQNTGVIWKDALVELSHETPDRAAGADDADPRTAMQAEAVQRCVDTLQDPQPELLDEWRKAGAKLDYLPKDVGRATLVLPCGTGKTRISAQVVDRLCADGDLAVMLVPSIALIPQARHAYLATLRDAGRQPVTIAVCSDGTAGHVSAKDEERRTDDPTADTGHTHATEIGCRTARSEAEVREFVEQDCRNDRLNVIFSTYQSAHHVAEALRRTKRHAQVLVCDEAHRTAQIKQIRRKQLAERIRNFTICHDQAGFPARYRLYQTATPKIFPADNKRVQNLDRTKYVVHSMSDSSVFGGVAYRVSYQSAVENDLLTDYRIIAFGVDEAAWAAADRICRQIEARERKEKRKQSGLGTADALAWLIYGIVLYGGVGGAEAEDRVRIRRSIAFLNRTARSKEMARWLCSADGREEIEAYFRAKKLPAPTGLHNVIHLDATHSAAQRRAELVNLANVNEGDTAGITNVGIFGEGTDTPSLDAVAILAPRKSPTDVIQIVGRCMRRSPEKTTGYVIVPVALPRGLDAETSLGMTDLGEEWKPLSQILTALRAHDGRVEDRVHDLLDIYVPPDERSEIERAVVAVDGNVVRTGVWKGPVDSSPEEVIGRVKPPAWRERPGRGPTELSDYLTPKHGFTWSEQRVVNDRPTDRITDRGPQADQELLKKFPAVDIIRRDRRGVRVAPHVKPVGSLDSDDGGFDVTETVSKGRAQANKTELLREPRRRRLKRAAPAAPGESPSLWQKLESHDPTRGLAVEVMERSGLRGNPARDFNLLQEPLHDAAGDLRADGFEGELRIRLGMEPAGQDGTASGEESGASACQVASLLVLNALILHARLEGTSGRVRELIGDCTLDSLGRADDPCVALSDGWTRVLEYDYRPVFEPARNVVNWLRDSERRFAGRRAVRRLAGWAAENADHYASMGMEYAGELFSRVMGHQAADGAFFTRPEAARLLAELALEEMDVERFSNAAEWQKLKAADLACGSGTLLNAWIEAVKQRMRAEGAHEGQCSTWHRVAVEELASGLDINPVSLQLAAGRFTLGNLEIDYRRMALYALEHGKTGRGAVRLGALELLGDDEIVGAAPDKFDWADDHIVHPDVKASLRGTRCVIMNPPFSDNVKRNRNLEPGVKARMQERELALRDRVAASDADAGALIDTNSLSTFFTPLAEKLLSADDGVVAKIMPMTACTGTSGAEERVLLASRLWVRYIVMCHDPKNINLSQKTKINECMLIATRKGRGGEEPTMFVKLSRYPKNGDDAARIARAIANGEWDAIGTACSWPAEWMRAGDWSPIQWYDSRLATAARDIVQASGMKRAIDLYSFGSGRSIRDEFEKVPVSEETTDDIWIFTSIAEPLRTTLDGKPDARWRVKPVERRRRRARAGLTEEHLEKASYVLAALSYSTTSSRTTAQYCSSTSIGTVYVPIGAADQAEAKALNVIWNSTPTLLQLLSMRSKKATYPQWSIHQLEGVRIPARVNDPNVVEVLAKVHDELAGQEIGRLQHAADDPVRHAIDASRARPLRHRRDDRP